MTKRSSHSTHNEVAKIEICKLYYSSNNHVYSLPAVDYFCFSSNCALPAFELELPVLSIAARPSKWYSSAVQTLSFYTNLEPKTPLHKSFNYRVNKGRFDHVLGLSSSKFTGLPIDGTISRLDICIDCDTLGEAVSLVTLKNIESGYFSSISSVSLGEDCTTYYFGSRRKSSIFERVYYKPLEKKWRYECELKPKSNNNARTLGARHFAQLHPTIKALYLRVSASFDTYYPVLLPYFDVVSLTQSIRLKYLVNLFIGLTPVRSRVIYTTPQGFTDILNQLKEIDLAYMLNLLIETRSKIHSVYIDACPFLIVTPDLETPPLFTHEVLQLARWDLQGNDLEEYENTVFLDKWNALLTHYRNLIISRLQS